MPLFSKLASVFAIGLLQLWVAIPAGLAMNLSPIVVCLVAASGPILCVLCVVLIGERLRTWILKRFAKNPIQDQENWLSRLWKRYGMISFGLIAPIIIGAPVAAAIAVALGVPGRQALLWTSLGILMWSVVITLLSVLGLTGLRQLIH